MRPNFYPTNATLVCVFSDIKPAVSAFFWSEDRYLGDGASDRCEILYDGR